MTNKEKELDHPCRDTCSGWKQGYDKGCQDALKHNPVVLWLVEDLTVAIKYLKEGKARFTPNTTNSFVDELIDRPRALTAYQKAVKDE